MKTKLIMTLGFLGLAPASHAQFAGINGGVLLGGGYLEDPGEGYAFLQLRGTFYEDDAIAHTVFFEILGHSDDAVLEFPFPGPGGGSFFENGDISFANFTLNYELEAKLGLGFSIYAGGGAGIEYVSLDDRFDFSIDSDSNFLAQTFAGIRFGKGISGQLGVRYLWREDFALLGDQFVTEDSFAYELSIGFSF